MKQWNYSSDRASTLSRCSMAALAASVFVGGLVWRSVNLLGIGAATLCFLLRRAWEAAKPDATGSQNSGNRLTAGTTHRVRSNASERQSVDEDVSSVGSSLQNFAPKSTDALVNELLANGRYALMLRPETKQHLTQFQVMRAIRQLDEAMSLVPAGRVLIGQLAEISNSLSGQSEIDAKLVAHDMVAVEPIYLDRYCVTNAEYQRFVDAGGYERLEFWHEEALPALLDFVDQSGAPGPCYWSDGQYPSDDQRLPVVGISWYEAWAYARWVGKRLPSDAEWTKAAAWPVESAPGRIAQRRYPWGESFDVRRAHLYGSGPIAPVAVDEFPGGTSIGGIHQLIGNVWEWTTTSLAAVADTTLHVPESVMTVRGGAFDTYFENQATCHFQSGEHALSRRRNIGFRLAIPMSAMEAPPEADLQTPQVEAEELGESSAELLVATR